MISLTGVDGMLLIMRQLSGIMLLSSIYIPLSGCKYVHGDAYTYQIVQHPRTGAEVNLAIQVVAPPTDAPTLENGLHPGLIFVHGGGWASGGRFDNGFDQEIKRASEKGYVAASIDYRLATRDKDGQTIFPWPSQIQDVKCAVRWLKSRATEFRLDPERIAVMGVSAGGHLAGMAAETVGRTDLESPDCVHAGDSSVAVAIVFSGVVDVETTWNGSGLVASQLIALTGISASPHSSFAGLDEPARAALLDLDPASAIGQADTPVLLVHPVDDFLVPVNNARQYFQALVAEGRAACMLTLDRGGHFTGADGSDANRFAKARMYQWLEHWFMDTNPAMACAHYPNVEHALVAP